VLAEMVFHLLLQERLLFMQVVVELVEHQATETSLVV
jgi:hypothetical protein